MFGHMTNHRLISALSLTLTLACGCDPGGGWFPSDLDEDDTLAAAGDTAVRKACDAFEDYLYDQYRGSLLVEVSCTALGIERTADAGSCGDFVSDCIDDPPAEVTVLIGTIVDQTGCGGLAYEPTGCAATLSDLRACLDAAEGAVDELRFTVECAAAGQPLPDGALTIDTPTACRDLELACPL